MPCVSGIEIFDTVGTYGASFDAGDLLALTMDPATHRVGVSATTTSFFGFVSDRAGKPIATRRAR